MNDFDILIGKRINKVELLEEDGVETYYLYCDDCKITIKTSHGCGGCSNGWSSIDDLKILEGNGVITNIIQKYNTEDEEERRDTEDDSFKLFVYYHDKTLEIGGDDGYGNGYYGGGFYIDVEKVEEIEYER